MKSHELVKGPEGETLIQAMQEVIEKYQAAEVLEKKAEQMLNELIKLNPDSDEASEKFGLYMEVNKEMHQAWDEIDKANEKTKQEWDKEKAPIE